MDKCKRYKNHLENQINELEEQKRILVGGLEDIAFKARNCFPYNPSLWHTCDYILKKAKI